MSMDLVARSIWRSGCAPTDAIVSSDVFLADPKGRSTLPQRLPASAGGRPASASGRIGQGDRAGGVPLTIQIAAKRSPASATVDERFVMVGKLSGDETVNWEGTPHTGRHLICALLVRNRAVVATSGWFRVNIYAKNVPFRP
jgi:hypothetical protein